MASETPAKKSSKLPPATPSKRDSVSNHIILGLKELYNEKLLPLEEKFKYDKFYNTVVGK